MTRPHIRFSAILALCLLATPPALAQEGLFAPRLTINGQVISNFEFEQRIQFLKLLRSPGDLEKLALDALIEDRLRIQEAKRLEIEATPEEILEGMTEFAARANLTVEQFTAALAGGGVEPETFRDFVEAGIVWREVVRARFGPRVDVNDTDIDRAIANLGRGSGVRLLLSELILPSPEGAEDETLAEAERLQQEISSEAAFAEAARSFSAAPSAERGGRLDWLPLANLPGGIGPVVLALAPGEVSDPVPIPGGVALFQLRGIEEIIAEAPSTTQVEYAQLALPNDTSFDAEAARLNAGSDGCDDLYSLLPGLPEEQLQRLTQTMAEVPADVGLELARLDAGESSTAIVRGGARLFLMLCNRTPIVEPQPTRAAIRADLLNTRLAAYADNLLADLRANAIIIEP
jgi:peptidyl-prolyl cis-trans isomerase SurA